MPDPLDLSGRVALVTGGARGVGRGITECLLDAGAEVVICGRNTPDDLPTSSGAGAGGAGVRTAVFAQGDVRDPDDVSAIIAKVIDTYGRLDILVNNAGGAPPADTATASPKFSTAIVSLNLIAPLICSQQANAVMQTQPEGGCIINIASVSATRPSPDTAAYGAAKAGLLNLTQTMAVEFAPKVRVNAVTAGMIRTEQSHLFYGDEEGIAAVGATVPLGRLGEPRDVANACLFLASSLASYVSGANLLVHGGGERPAFLDAAKNTTP